MYIRVIFQPNSPQSSTIAISFTIGDEIRKEKVTPNGTPASINPINNGTAEQEQKGVIIPTKAANKLFRIGNLDLDKNFLVFSGGKNELITDMT